AIQRRRALGRGEFVGPCVRRRITGRGRHRLGCRGGGRRRRCGRGEDGDQRDLGLRQQGPFLLAELALGGIPAESAPVHAQPHVPPLQRGVELGRRHRSRTTRDASTEELFSGARPSSGAEGGTPPVCPVSVWSNECAMPFGTPWHSGTPGSPGSSVSAT